MSTILFLEDDDSAREHITGLLYLEDEGYEVKSIQRIDQAKEYFTAHKDEILCIVTDLNMSDEFLGKYRKESNGCTLSGWVWLKHFVYPDNPDMPTVIYSGFIDELKDSMPKAKWETFIKRKNIKIIERGGDHDEGFDGLIKAIKKVTQEE